MIATALRRPMLRVGRAAGGNRAGLRAVALALAAFVVTIGSTAAVTVVAGYDGRSLRDAARTPVLAEPAGAEATSLWDAVTDNVNLRYVDVVYLVPLVDDAPLPPGLDRWPAPGEVLLSPALAAQPEGSSVAGRYGRVVGTIGADGLATPTERLAYVRPLPETLDRPAMVEIAGYGVAPGTGVGLGDALRARDRTEFLILVAVFLWVPGAALLITAARMGSAARDRRLALVTSLGATPGARHWLLAGESGPPLLLGVALGALPAAAGIAVDLPLPGLDYVVAAVDLRRFAGWLVGAVVLAATVSLLAVLVLHRPPRRAIRLVRPLASGGSAPAGLAVCCVAAAYLTVRITTSSINSAGPVFLVYVAGVLLSVALFPALLGWLLARVGAGLAWLGRRRGMAGSLVAGRQLGHDTGVHVRLVAGLGIAVVLLMQTQVWVSKLSQFAVEAERVQATVGDSVLVLSTPSDARLVQPVLDALQPNVLVLARTIEPADNRVRLQGDCSALRALALPCASVPTVVGAPYRDTALQAIADSLGRPEVVAQIGPPVPSDGDGSSGSSLLLISADGHPLSIGAVKETLNRHVAPALYVDSVGGLYLEGAQLLRDQGRWVSFLGAAGLLVVALGIAVAAVAQCAQHSRTMAPLAALSGRSGVFLVASTWRMLVPVVLSGGLGVVLGRWLTLPVTAPGSGGVLPTWVVPGCLAASIVLGMVLALLAARASQRAADSWLPGAAE